MRWLDGITDSTDMSLSKLWEMVKASAYSAGDWVRSLGQEDPLEKEMATHSSTLAWKIPWTAARQATLSITNSRSLPKLKSIESVMPSNHLILCRSLLLLPSILPIIRVFSNELAHCHQVAKNI